MQNFPLLKTPQYLLQDLCIGRIGGVVRYPYLLFRGSRVQSPVWCPSTHWFSSFCPGTFCNRISVYVANRCFHILPNLLRTYYHSPTHKLKERLPIVDLRIILIYRVIRNDCRGFNNLSYTIHLRYKYVFAPMDQEILSFLLWCAVCSSYAFLRLERSSLRWRRKTLGRHFVCLHFMSVGQLQLLRNGSSLCSSSSRKHPGTEGTNHNRQWNHHRWHATNSLERTRLSC